MSAPVSVSIGRSDQDHAFTPKGAEGSLPTVIGLTEGSYGANAGVQIGDEILSINGQRPIDIIEYRMLVDEPEVELAIRRGGLTFELEITKPDGAPLGIELGAPIFDQVRTCDNHCEFCFIYQLPPGMRKSLYLKDDDYRLSFLYGNFTTLTRFTEADLERVLTEGLSPLYVSIHATDPATRIDMLRNVRGGTSLRWLRALLDAGVEVHGQIVVCPGLNDGDVLADTLDGILDEYPELLSVAVVPLGVSRFSTEQRMRPHTTAEAAAVIDLVERAQEAFIELRGAPVVYCSDEYYLLAGRPFPPAERYGEFDMYEDGIGMARAFEADFDAALESTVARLQAGDSVDASDAPVGHRPASGFFSWVDGAPAEGYRAPRTAGDDSDAAGSDGTGRSEDRQSDPGSSGKGPLVVLTGPLGAPSIAPLVDKLASHLARISGPLIDSSTLKVHAVPNDYFGGNVGVTGLMVGEDVAREVATFPVGTRFLLPDVCLSRGVFLDGTAPAEVSEAIEIIPTDGAQLAVRLVAELTGTC